MSRFAQACLIPAVAGLVSTFAYTAPAEACGGTFCDAGPAQMPVDQSGENILFVIDGTTVEAHVQIQYDGDPENFAWVVPVMAEPEIESGSDPFFANLLAATVPTFTLQTRFEACEDDRDRGGGLGCMAFRADETADGGLTGGGLNAGEDDDGTPDVIDVGVAGAFEFAVLSGGTVEGVVGWLDENQYAQDPEAEPILAEYLAEGFMFVAFKLRGGAEAEEIHPVVIRYQGAEPCVPIRLTRIAAEDDMGIRAFFLGEHRVAPTNYRSVQINPLRVDWVNLGANYDSLVTRAVDGRGAEGHGFVTEFAGPSNIVSTSGIVGPRWDSGKFITATADEAADELRIQGLIDPNFDADAGFFAHPLIEGMLEKYLPRPPGVTASSYYGCIECYVEDEADLESWNGAEFAAEFEERIVAPAEHAVDLLAQHPYLTRLYTTISPHEMTADPLFHENADLQDVSATYTATQVFTCEGPDYIELVDGRRIALSPDGTTPEDMPWAVAIEEVPPSGAPMVLVDELDSIEEARSAWNAEMGLGAEEGCNCRASKRNVAGAAWMLLILGFAGLARRRGSIA